VESTAAFLVGGKPAAIDYSRSLMEYFVSITPGVGIFPGEQAVTRNRVIASYRNRAADQIAAVDSPA
jgi:hypothetical protein